ncbi:Kanadaptin [Thelohanellus kitauei]|uniref:Kanadaptin n=1 Tax=Thelohanellus kitauei TaxID=669202 RepID=A0A0C2MIQ0_THEKT|nr:Kanadaptin [Thelohanellus kitauei]
MASEDLFKAPQPKNINSPAKFDIPEWAETFPDGSYFEVIHRGVLCDPIKINPGTRKFILGRSPESNGVLDSILVSKSHILIVFGNNGEESPKFWACDLGSQNKSKINKNKLAAFIYYPLNNEDVIQLADNEFTLILHIQSESKVPKVIDLLKKPENIPKTSEKPKIKPRELINQYFERKGLEPEFNITSTKSGETRFKATLALTVYDENGTEMVASVLSNDKKSIIDDLCEEACKIIEQYDNLLEEETFEQRSKRQLVENDYYEEDEDTFYDRSGQIEKKRDERMKRFGCESKVPRDNTGLSDDDELEAYMKNLDTEIATRDLERFSTQLDELLQEESEITKILSSSAPVKEIKEFDIGTDVSKAPKTKKTKLDTFSKSIPVSENLSISGTRRKADPIVCVFVILVTQEKKIKTTEKSKYSDIDEEYEWHPPDDQTGDGQTSLNAKYSY